jgi:hypothetical protein
VSRSPAEGDLQTASSFETAGAPHRPSLSLALGASVLILVVTAVALRLLQAGNTVDDAYITYRYAAHLASGEGLVYNPGERVLGTSSPVYALVLAGLSFVTGVRNLPLLSLWLNAAVDGLAALGLFVLVRRLSPYPAGAGSLIGLLVAGLYALDAKSVDFSTGGMESPLFVAVLVGIALLLAWDRHLPAAVLAGLSCWIRPDGGLMAAALLFSLLWVRRHVPWRELAVAAVPVAVFLALAWLAYGDPLPASLRAKAAGVYQLPPDHALRYLARHLAGMTIPRLPLGRALPFLPGTAREYATLATTSLLPLALMVFGARRAAGGGSRASVLFVALYAAGFVVAFAWGNPFMMGWYYVPLETAYLVLLGLGAGAVATVAYRRGLGVPLAPRGRLAFAVGLVLLVLLVPQLRRYQWLPASGVRAASLRSEWEKIREQDYRRVGRDLEQATKGRARIAGPEIGALGYVYSGPILDTVGLVSPEARAYYPLPAEIIVGNNAIPPDLIADQLPDFVVFLEIFGRRGLLRDARFARDYRLWRVYPSRTFGSRGLLVYVRRSSLW